MSIDSKICLQRLVQVNTGCLCVDYWVPQSLRRGADYVAPSVKMYDSRSTVILLGVIISTLLY